MIHACLTGELGDIGGLAWDQSQWHDTRNVHLWAIDMHIQAKLNTDILDVLETFLVVGTSTSDPDLDLVLDEERRYFS